MKFNLADLENTKNFLHFQTKGFACCRALTAGCLSCAAGMTISEYCASNADVIGCEGKYFFLLIYDLEDVFLRSSTFIVRMHFLINILTPIGARDKEPRQLRNDLINEWRNPWINNHGFRSIQGKGK